MISAKAMICFVYFLQILVPISCLYYNVYEGDNEKWRYGDLFKVSHSSIVGLSGVLSVEEKRSFVECCGSCDVSEGCAGIAYYQDRKEGGGKRGKGRGGRGGQCLFLNVTAGENLKKKQTVHGVYTVMLYDTVETIRVSGVS